MSHKVFRLLTTLTLLLVLALTQTNEAFASAFTVNTTADAVDASPGDSVCNTGTGECTLRAAIQEANALPGNDTITLPTGTYTLALAGADEDAAATGDLDITDNLTINGAGAPSTIIDGNALDRIFQLDPFQTGISIAISGVTIQNGNAIVGGGISNFGVMTLTDTTISDNAANFGGGGILNGGTATATNSTISGNTTNSGGGIDNQSSGTFTLINSTVSNNVATSGGGITNNGTMDLTESTISNNASYGEGGGIRHVGVSLTLNNSTVNGNTASSFGGGIFNSGGTVILTNSTINNNTATDGSGGGIENRDFSTLSVTNTTINGNTAAGAAGIANLCVANATVINSTISGNTSTLYDGGGITNCGSLTLNSTTISRNTANDRGGGISNFGPLSLINSILAGNVDISGQAPECWGATLDSQGYNLIQDITGCTITGDSTGNLIGADPILGPLQDNGGPTFTHALLSGSPAIDAGNPAGCMDHNGNLLITDQRGVARIGICDIGAYEVPTAGLLVSGGNNQQTGTTFAFPQPLQATVFDDQGSPASGVTVTFTAPASGPSGTFVNSGTNTTEVVTDEGGVATTSTFIANDQAGAYTVLASASGLGSVNFNLEQIDRPANDNFANAEPFTSLPFTAIADITNATNEQSNEPQNCYSMDQTLWYSFTPTESMVVVVNSGDGAIFTNVNIYRAGSGISDLQFLSCTGAGAFTTFSAEANQTYYLQVGSTFGEVGYIRIDLEQFPPPVNDNFAAATLVSSLPSTIDFGTIAATFETNEPSACGYPAPPYKTIWYSFTASQTGSVSASIPSSNFSPFLTIFSGTGLGSLTQLGCGQYSNRVTFRALQGQTYYFQVGGYYGESGYGTFLLEVAPPPQANFYFYPGDPTKYDTIQFCSSSNDPGNVGIQSFTWDFGDGATATEGCATHRYTADGDYTVQHTVTTFDGRTASTTQVVQVRTHDVAITRIAAPNTANSGQTKSITVSLRNNAYPETVQVDLYKSVPGGYIWVGSLTLQVPVSTGNKTTTFSINYTFTAQDAQVGKVTFRAVATIVDARDAFPSDNEAISSPPTKVNKGR